MIAALLVATWAAEPDEAVVDVLADWARRATDELVLDGVRPYRTVIAAYRRERTVVVGELGSLYNESETVGHPAMVEVIVGDDARNSSRFQARNQRTLGARVRPSLVIEPVPLALSRDLWLTTDASFKDAVTRLPQKLSAYDAVATAYPPDWLAAPPVRREVSVARPPLDVDVLRRLAVEGSAAFRGLPSLRNGWVEVAVERGDLVVVDSDGMRTSRPEDHAVIYAWCDALRSDGVHVYEERTWVVDGPDHLPSVDVVREAAAAMAARVDARTRAAVVADYEGPVLFEGEAAAQLVGYLATRELEGTPPEPQAGVTYEQLVRGGPRLGRRLLPPGWSAWDDPASVPVGAPGGFDVDLEGVPAQRVELVRDGRVVDLVRSRVPRDDGAPSNGHARGSLQTEWDARLASLTVEAPRAMSSKAVARAAGRAARAAEVPALLVVRSMHRGRPGSLPRVQEGVWRYADGHEEPVVSLQFQYTNRRMLKDVLAAGGGTATRTFFASAKPGGSDGTTTGLPTTVRVPAMLLIDDVEATFPGPDSPPDAYPMPPLSGE